MTLQTPLGTQNIVMYMVNSNRALFIERDPNLVAAGDIRAGSTKRVGFAVGDGSLAVTCVHKLTAIRN